MGFLDILFGKNKKQDKVPEQNEYKAALIEEGKPKLIDMRNEIIEDFKLVVKRRRSGFYDKDDFEVQFINILKRQTILKGMYLKFNEEYVDIDFQELNDNVFFPEPSVEVKVDVIIENDWDVPIEKKDIKSKLGEERQQLYSEQKKITNDFNLGYVNLDDSLDLMRKWKSAELVLEEKYKSNGLTYNPIFEYWNSKAKI